MRSTAVGNWARFLFVLGLLCLLPICASADVAHPAIGMHSAYQADALSNARIWSGYLGEAPGSPAYQGTLRITPGDRWSNFVSAAQAGVSYSIKNISLVKTAPVQQRCTEVFPEHTVVQEGTANIRLVWPLLYEAPGTAWTLTVLYGTSIPWDDDGEGPNPSGFNHVETWTWTLGADVAHLKQLLILFHDTAFGKSSVPVMGDEAVYASLLGLLSAAQTAEASSDYVEARARLEEFRTAVQDACVSEPPGTPRPAGSGMGIAGTPENPACCKLQVEVDLILSQPPYTTGLGSITGASKSTKPTPAPQPSVSSVPVAQSCIVSSALAGDSAGNPVEYRGLSGIVSGAVTIPGVIGITPGTNWSNFIGAAQQALPYTIMNLTLQKSAPVLGACSDVFSSPPVAQQGNSNIRLWWPLMYEPGGTTWTLNILYRTSTAYDDDGAGPNPPGYFHTEVWTWELQPELSTISSEMALFHYLPFGTSEVPLISDEELYTALQGGLDATEMAMQAGDTDTAAGALAGVAWAIDGSGIAGCPPYPSPTGPGTGIAATSENPTVCKLLSDIDYMRAYYGICATSSLDVIGGNSPTMHPPITVNAAYEGDLEGTDRVFAGYDPSQSGAAAYPGVLSIEPGDNWSNFVGAGAAGISYVWGDAVGLRMTTPQMIQCGEMFPSRTISQTYGANIRLRWPLLYSSAGTRWRVTTAYETPIPWDDDGPGPNGATYFHADVWEWVLKADVASMKNRMRLLHDVPAGLSSSPLVSDDALYPVLIEKLDDIQEALDSGHEAEAAYILSDFELMVMDSCIGTAPPIPYATGPGTGILNTEENPACCSLLADAEYLGAASGIIVAGKEIGSRSTEVKTAAAAKPAVTSSVPKVASGSGGAILHPQVMLSPASMGSSGDVPTKYLGYNGEETGSVPFAGVLGLLPGTDWANFIAAAHAGVSYTLGDVVLTKKTPAVVQCSEILRSQTTVLSGAESIRLWWPLLYDVRGTTYNLELTYHTETDQQFPGETAPSQDHTEQWQWEVGTGCPHLMNVNEVFHALPFGRDDVPLISDESLFPILQAKLGAIQDSVYAGDVITAEMILGDFEMEVMDACIVTSPWFPNPTGPGTGIANSSENPACCYLLSQAESMYYSLATRIYHSVTDAVRHADDGEPVMLEGPLIVTLLGSDWLYAQSTDRSVGVKALAYTGGLSLGARIWIRGIIDTSGPERVIQAAGWVVLKPSGSLPRPLGMVSRRVGGSGQGLLPGFPEAKGLWNGGLRVMVAGVAGAHGDGFFYLDDGSECQDGTGNSGLRTLLPDGVAPPDAGSKVRVIGVSSWFDNEGVSRPAIRAGTGDDDVEVLTGAS